MVYTSTLQEVLLVEHFGTPLPLTVLDMADWAREFSKYPKAQQLHMVPPVQLSGPGPISFSFGLAQSELPRLLLRSENGERTVQLQAGPIWFRVGEKRPHRGDAPNTLGSRQSSSIWLRKSRKFRTWCARENRDDSHAQACRVGYHNATPSLSEASAADYRIFFDGCSRIGRSSGFQVSWSELLQTNRPDAPRVSAVVAVGSVPPVTEALIFNFTGFAPIDKDEDG